MSNYNGYEHLAKNQAILLSKIKEIQRLDNQRFVETIRKVRDENPFWSHYVGWQRFVSEEIEFRKLIK